jgi:hypothetical protein
MIAFLRQLLAGILAFLVTFPPTAVANDQLATDLYDANGNTTQSNGTGYAYDFVLRLQ